MCSRAALCGLFLLWRVRLLRRPPGFNVETVEYKNLTCTVWDVGGQDVVRCLGGLWTSEGGGGRVCVPPLCDWQARAGFHCCPALH